MSSSSQMMTTKPTLRHASRKYINHIVPSATHAFSHLPEHILSPNDIHILREASNLSLESQGETQPHPNAACIVTDTAGVVISRASLLAQGTTPPERLACQIAGHRCRGGTAYLNLETGDCHGEHAGVRSLLHSGIQRVVIGMRHPLSSHRDVAISILQEAGIHVAILDYNQTAITQHELEKAMDAVTHANEHLLHRAVFRRPLGVLKYAMTLDGKIAASSGHAAWVSSTESRRVVFDTRATSDAVIVGGQTVRRDNPRLTTRRNSGHQPVRIVMSRTLDLPEGAALWDLSTAPTIVATQRGARQDFQRVLRSKGVEVVEFDFLTPDEVSKYCYRRGFLSCLWECGGKLAAPAISQGAIHKVLSFVAPKIIGGITAPTPVGDLGFVEMTQALDIVGSQWQPVGPDMLMTGYLPRSGGPRSLADALGLFSRNTSNHTIATMHNSTSDSNGHAPATILDFASKETRNMPPNTVLQSASKSKSVISFYKAWDRFGALSNFSPHPICMPEGPMTFDVLRSFNPPPPPSAAAAAASPDNTGKLDAKKQPIGMGWKVWPSTEHYYQAQKFAGVDHPDAHDLVEKISEAESPEIAALIGRKFERSRPDVLREDWSRCKVAAMHAALRAKFAQHSGPRNMLLSTIDKDEMIVESSPHDYFWGDGFDGSGQNMLGQLLMVVRSEMAASSTPSSSSHAEEVSGRR